MQNAAKDHRKYLRNLLLHFRPTEVPERTLRLTLTWGLGGIAFVLFLLLVLSGLALKFVYEPFPDRAYDSILYLRDQVPFGRLLRNLHRWSGNGLLLVSWALDRMRASNWLIGLALLAFAVLSNFTGYLLPWDQIAYWAITISTSMLDYLPLAGPPLKQWILGGSEPGPAALLNFYAIHTAILPALLLLLLPFHFWRVRKAGGLVVPRNESEPMGTVGPLVETVPHLVTREVTMTVLTLLVILLTAMFLDAPLAAQANPGLSPNPTKAPWYFMGLQEMLLHFHPLFAAVVIPGLACAGLVCLPWLAEWHTAAGVWFGSARGRRLVLLSLLLGVAASVAGVLLDEYVLTGELAAPTSAIRNGLLPFGVIVAALAGYGLLLHRVLGASRIELVQALFSVLASAFVVLTLVGFWFRGAGMQLGWSG